MTTRPLAALLAAALLLPSRALPIALSRREYRLRLHQIHTEQSIDVVYRRGDAYDARALARLDYFLRDYRTGAILHFDPRLYDLLSDLELAVGRPGARIDVVCGYRTPWTNADLRRRGHHTAVHSLHMLAEAVDIRLPGVSAARLRDAALSLRRGGVGYYPEAGFVHVDLGRVRRW